jgi:integrase/recombinase XerD
MPSTAQALKLQGKRSKTIDGYARAVRRIAGYFNRCPDNLTTVDLKAYFAWMVENYSWSSVKVDLWGLSFFYRHVLARPMEWVDIIKPPNSRSLPDIPTCQEVQLLINSVYRLRYRVYFFALYSMGLRLGEGLGLEVRDIDAASKRVHVRQGKGGKDRYVPLPDATLLHLRRFWCTHRNPRHAYAIHLLELGVDLRSIQVVMGHQKPETTARYAHLTEVNRQQAKDRIEDLVASINLRWNETTGMNCYQAIIEPCRPCGVASINTALWWCWNAMAASIRPSSPTPSDTVAAPTASNMKASNGCSGRRRNYCPLIPSW